MRPVPDQLFAFRARHPATLLAAEEPVGLRTLLAAGPAPPVQQTLSAWGRHGPTQAGTDCQGEPLPRWLSLPTLQVVAPRKNRPTHAPFLLCKKPSDLLALEDAF